jgi:hypothetical protein
MITNTPYALEVFMTPITTFEETLDRHKVIVAPTCLQILIQVEHVKEINVEHVEGAINQPIAEDQENLDL